jgi:hypothetical protein
MCVAMMVIIHFNTSSDDELSLSKQLFASLGTTTVQENCLKNDPGAITMRKHASTESH